MFNTNEGTVYKMLLISYVVMKASSFLSTPISTYFLKLYTLSLIIIIALYVLCIWDNFFDAAFRHLANTTQLESEFKLECPQ